MKTLFKIWSFAASLFPYFRCITGLLLLAKVVMANDIHASFRQDPLELWTALGVALLLIHSLPPVKKP